MSLSSNDKVPQARLCHVVKWDDFEGYGFNLHAEKGKSGQYIGKVDEGSPSEAAGLKQGDRIVEVNEINISNETHKQVVERIKAFPNETKLLVVDQEADEYFKNNNIIIKGTTANVKVLKTPDKNPATDGQEFLSSSNASSNYARSVGSNSSIDELLDVRMLFDEDYSFTMNRKVIETEARNVEQQKVDHSIGKMILCHVIFNWKPDVQNTSCQEEAEIYVNLNLIRNAIDVYTTVRVHK